MKFTPEELRKLGVEPGKPNKSLAQRKAERASRDHEERLFDAMCLAHHLPLPEREFRFATSIGRDWRFDYLWDGWLALEVEGGHWTGGAHTRGKHFESDMEKYNEAWFLGFAVLRCTVAQKQSGAACALVARALHHRLEE